MIRFAALLICCLPALCQAETARIGRLFLSPAERATLDVIRQNSKPPERIIKADEPPVVEEAETRVEAPPTPAQAVVVQGYVRRSDGKGTVWVNGQAVQEKTAVKDFEIGRLRGDTDQVQIKLPQSGKTIGVKPGQRYDPASGRIANMLKKDNPSALPSAPLQPPQNSGGGKPAKENADETAGTTAAPSSR